MASSTLCWFTAAWSMTAIEHISRGIGMYVMYFFLIFAGNGDFHAVKASLQIHCLKPSSTDNVGIFDPDMRLHEEGPVKRLRIHPEPHLAAITPLGQLMGFSRSQASKVYRASAHTQTFHNEFDADVSRVSTISNTRAVHTRLVHS
jgi:hypothetical protein